MENKKVKLGQFFTKASIWLKPQVIDFISNTNTTVAYDPYAGGGDLLNASRDLLGFKKTIGLDIDSKLNWEVNDSLKNIPHIENAIIITNPPYLAKQSAVRKKIDLKEYWEISCYDDLYLIALERMIEAQKNVVAIIPESFINSSFKKKDLLSSITILEENPFEDTECPVVVACFDGIKKSLADVKIYKNERYINSLEFINSVRLEPNNKIKIIFNTLDGWLGLRAVDSTDDKTFIHFAFKEDIDYDWEHRIKVSSRHFSLIDVDIPARKKSAFVSECNKILNDTRSRSSDILLTPFMGNTKGGTRRRRLDFRLARAIIEKAYKNVMEENEYGK